MNSPTVRHAMKYPAIPQPTAWVGDVSEGRELHLEEPSWGGTPLWDFAAMQSYARAAMAQPAQAPALSDERIKALCAQAGIRWIDATGDTDFDYPGGFDMCSLDEMCALLAQPVPQDVEGGGV